MASTYSTLLRITLPTTGELSGTWGATVNSGITQMLEQALAGRAVVAMTDADYTPTALNGVSDEARNMVMRFTGTLTAGRNIIIPAQSKLYIIENATTGGFALTLKTPSGTGVAVPAGSTLFLRCDGTNVVTAYNANMTAATGILPIANGGTGSGTAVGALQSLGITTGATGSLIVPSGTTAQRDGTPVPGYIRYNTSTAAFEGYSSGVWGTIGSLISSVSVNRQTFTATNGQTTFTIPGGYTPGYMDVYYNGAKLNNGADVTVTSGTDVVLAIGAAAGAVVETVAYAAFAIANGVTQTSSTGSAVIPSGTTGQRDGAPANSFFRYNTTLTAFEGYRGGAWTQFAAAGLNGDITGFSGLTNINGGQLAGLRNRIINGGMQVAQRSAPTLSGSYQYGQCDRWQFGAIGGTGISGTIVQNYFTVFASGYSGGVGAASWTNGQFFALQRIEARNVADLGGKTVTVSAKVYQDTGGTRSFIIQIVKATAGTDNWGTQANIGTSSAFPATTGVVTPISASFTLGSSDHLNGLGVIIQDSATNTVVSKSYYIGDVQLEVGSVATTFEQRPYGLELALCQRYYCTISLAASVYSIAGYAQSATTAYSAVTQYPVPMRVQPTVTLPSAGQTAGTISFVNANGSYPATTGSHNITYAGVNGFAIGGSGYSGLTSGGPAFVFSSGASTITASAEL